MKGKSLVTVIDDDESVRESLPDLLREFGFSVLAFSSAEDFLASGSMDKVKCLILDMVMPGMSGPQLQEELIRRQQEVPIIYITAHADESLRPRLPRTNAVACLIKPFSEAALIAAINFALAVG